MLQVFVFSNQNFFTTTSFPRFDVNSESCLPANNIKIFNMKTDYCRSLLNVMSFSLSDVIEISGHVFFFLAFILLLTYATLPIVILTKGVQRTPNLHKKIKI